MGFFSALFGGPSAQQKQLTGNEAGLAQSFTSAFNQQFKDQGQILQNLNSQLTPIANLGPNQQGFSPQELAAMNTQAINASGAAARNAQQAVAGSLAGRGGGGTSGLTSGIDQQIAGAVASSAANQLSGAQEDITQKNYEVGRDNFWKSTAGERSLASAYTPEAYGNLASSTNQSALQDENTLTAERKAAAFAPIGLAMKGVGAALGGFANLDTTGSSSFGEQLGNFGSGAFNSLAGNPSGSPTGNSSLGGDGGI